MRWDQGQKGSHGTTKWKTVQAKGSQGRATSLPQRGGIRDAGEGASHDHVGFLGKRRTLDYIAQENWRKLRGFQ